MVETTKTMKKKMVNRAYRSVPKTGTKIYGGIEGDKRDEPVTATSIAGKHMLCRGNDSKRKQHFLQQKGKRSNNKKPYINGLKSTRRKVCFAAVFVDIRRDTFIHTAEMTAMRELQKKKRT